MLDGTSTAEALITLGFQSWTDYTVTTRTKLIDDGVAGANKDTSIVFRYKDPLNFYLAGLGLYNNFAGILRVVNGVYETLVATPESDQTIVYGQNYDLKVVAVGSTIQLFVNNVLKLQYADSTFASGGVGLRLYNTHAQYDFIDVAPSTSPIPWWVPIPLVTLAGVGIYLGVKGLT